MHTIFKTIIINLYVLCWTGHLIQAQEYQPDPRLPLLKEDAYNQYQSDAITQLDVLHALDFMGVRLQKFKLGRFDTAYQLHLFAETYEHGELIRTDTMLAEDNQYAYFEPGKTDYSTDFIDQLKFITKEEDNRSEVRLYTYALSTKMNIELKKWDERQFYNWRFYSDAHWELNKKIPLMVFASSWLDPHYDFHRFCGVIKLTEGDEGTEELLRESPTYVLFSYQVRPMD